jgi:YVTN family beta-propeller protein
VPRATAFVLATLALFASASSATPFAYITNQGSHDVSVIDLASQQVVATVPVGRSPASVVASSRAGKVFVCDPDSKTISVIDTRSQQVVATLPAGEGPVGIAASQDGSRLYAVDWFKDRLMVCDTLTDQLVATIAVGRAPAGVAANDDDGNTVFVAERDDDSVVDVAEQRVRARVRVGTHPFALLRDAARQRLYALNVQSDDVSVIDTRTLAVVKTIKVTGVYKSGLENLKKLVEAK